MLTNNVEQIYSKIDLVLETKNRREKIIPMIIILAYSAIKIRAKPSLPYSILKPDTSSDSPSAKSNGVRLVSARQETNQIIVKGIKTIDFSKKLFMEDNNNIFILELNTIKNIKIKPNLISYEIVCAIARREPIRAYFLFLVQPEISTGNTFILRTIYINRQDILSEKTLS